MVAATDLPERWEEQSRSYRLIASKFPPIALFEDVADAEDFQALYELQALTNPRLLAEAGDLGLIPLSEIPFGIPGCSYAVAPFTHVNPEGSRFSDGAYGVLYLADAMDTAIAEVRYHQQAYLQKVQGLHFDRLVFRGLTVSFAERLSDATRLSESDAVYDPEDYDASQTLGRQLRQVGARGLRFHSVRAPGQICWGLFTPKGVKRAIQTTHYEFIWNGQAIDSVSALTAH